MKDYYQKYLENHSNPKCRLMHFIGQLATIAYVLAVVLSGSWALLFLAPFVIYPFAISGHILFGEKGDRPSFSKMGFVKAKIADWRMFVDILRGKLKIW